MLMTNNALFVGKDDEKSLPPFLYAESIICAGYVSGLTIFT